MRCRSRLHPAWRTGSPRRASHLAPLAFAAALAAVACSHSAPPAKQPPNLILVTVDTLRADHLGIYGYPRDTSPNLDALARDGVWFSRVYSQSATTGAAHASLFTSLTPAEHGVFANRQQYPALPTIMSALRARGYLTAGFASSVVVGRKSGLQNHFDRFDDQLTTVEANRSTRYERPADDTVAAVKRFLDGLPPAQPFFVWMHLIDPHGPYAAPIDPDRYVGDTHYDTSLGELPIGATDWEYHRIPRYQVLDGRTEAAFYIARYDAEIRYADAALGTLFADLKARGLWPQTVIAVTADHGETLVEAGHQRYFTHGAIAYEETVRIPLIVHEPKGSQRLAAVDRDGPVSSLDVAPTLLALLDVEAPPGFRGRNLLRDTLDDSRPIVSMGAYGSVQLEQEIGTQFSLLHGPFRLIINSKDGSEELYDHRTDAVEATNLVSHAPGELAALRAELAPAIAGRGVAAAVPAPSAEQAASLRALGYVE